MCGVVLCLGCAVARFVAGLGAGLLAAGCHCCCRLLGGSWQAGWLACCAVKLHHARPRQRVVGLLAPPTWPPFPPQTGQGHSPRYDRMRILNGFTQRQKKKRAWAGILCLGCLGAGREKAWGICEWNSKRNTSARQPISRLRRASSCSRDANEDVPTHTCRTDG